MSQPLQIWICRPWESFIQMLIVQSEQRRRDHERELDLERARELDWEEPEVVDPEIVPAAAVLVWDAYREHYL